MKTNSWPKVRLGDHVDLLAGFAFKSARFTADPDDIALIKGENVGQGKILWDISKRWPKSELKQYSRFELRKDDVVLAMDRPWVPAGLKYAWIKEADPKCLLVQRVARLRGINGLDSKFLRFAIGSPQFTDYLKPIVTGVNVPHISGRQIEDFQFPLPPIEAQREITEILSAYDDLIENNTRRIKILEDMAQALYREWFVHFRFPGHKKLKLGHGKIPQGWELKRLADLSEIVMGQSPKSEFYNEIGEGLPFHQGVTDFGDRFPVDRVYCTVENRVAGKRDILCSVRAPVGRLNIANKKIVIGRGLCAIRSKTDSQCFLFHQLSETFQEEDNIGGGTIFKAVTKDDMHNLQMLWPEESNLTLYDDFVRPMFRELEILTNKNFKLRRTRDLLLPKLIYGELSC